MEVATDADINNGEETQIAAIEVTSVDNISKQKLSEAPVKKKRRRGKSKRNVMKPFKKLQWQDRQRNDSSKRNNRYRKIVLAKTHAPAPFNNNQFLMEIHKPEPENDFQILQTPSARTRDSSFSVDSEENYFLSLPEDEEDFLIKEFSSVYEDAQSERLANMSKAELIQEYLLLQSEHNNLKNECGRNKAADDDLTDKDMSTDRESVTTDRDTSATSVECSAADESFMQDLLVKLKEQEQQIVELKMANERLQLEHDRLRKKYHCPSSEDSESDSSSTSISCSSSSRADSPVNDIVLEVNENIPPINEEHNGINGENGVAERLEVDYTQVNGYGNHSSNTDDQ